MATSAVSRYAIRAAIYGTFRQGRRTSLVCRGAGHVTASTAATIAGLRGPAARPMLTHKRTRGAALGYAADGH